MSLISRTFSRLAFRRGNIRNGLVPAANMYATLVRAQNHAMAYRTKREVYRRAWKLGAITGASGTNTIGRFRFRTSPGATTLTYVVIMGIDNSGGLGPPSGANPYLDIETTLSGGATTVTSFHGGHSAVNGNDSPSQQTLLTSDVSVTASSVYTVAIKSQDYGRPLAIVAYEQAVLTVDESTNWYNTMNAVAAHPIYDADRQRLVQGANALWKAGGGTHWHWHLHTGASRSRSSATPISILDDTTTGTPATSGYGFYLDLTSHNTLTATTVPFELAMYADPNGGTANVRLIDSGGSTYGPVSGTGAAGWFSTAINLPTASTFYTAQYYGDGAIASTVSAISLIEYTP